MPKFECPPPLIYSDANTLEFNETAEFKIKNIGEGILEGKIYSLSDKIFAEPRNFKGNDLTVRVYSHNAEQVVISKIVISSNGGQICIPVKAARKKNILTLPNGKAAEAPEDFNAFADDYPVEARKLINKNDFYIWIKNTNLIDMEVFEHIIRDSNKERALDNLLMLMGMRKKTFLKAEKNFFEYKTGRNDIMSGSAEITKEGKGYISEEIFSDGKPWLEIKSKIINSSSFSENGKFLLRFEINPLKLQGIYDEDTVRIGEMQIKIKLTKISKIRIRLDKYSYRFGERGLMEIINDSSEDIELFIQSSSFIRLCRSIRINALCSRKAAFDIRLSPIIKFQMDIAKKPNMTGSIKIYGKGFYKELKLPILA